MKPYSVYSLQLEDECWYIGISKDVQRRLLDHMSSPTGAQWTRLHKPIKIAETIETTAWSQSGAAQYENMLTLQYALKYGQDKVRGGRYCNIKHPNYPK